MKPLPPSARSMLDALETSDGARISNLMNQPLLLIFLRHLGCIFNVQTLRDLQRQRTDIEQSGVSIVLAHMATDRQADLLLRQFALHDMPRVSDPHRHLYQAFGLRRASLREFFNAQTLRRGVEACVKERQLFAVPQGDALQMPGYFLIEDGHIASAFVPRFAWQLPDYRTISEPRLAHLALI